MSLPERSRVDLSLERILPAIERVLRRGVPAAWVAGLIEFLVFGIKQAWACLFGGLLLAAMLISHQFYPDDLGLNRYDALFLYAIGLQVLFLVTRLERPQEALVILIFHLVGTAMEVFKTDVGSWTYPEESLFKVGNVPLFSGFMYAAVGSYFARASRVFEFRWQSYPAQRLTLILAAGIYVNFFSHHFIIDLRYALFALTGLLFWRTNVYYRVWRWQHRMPLLVGFVLVSLFIWLAENLATFARIWLYPDQENGWQMVSLQKLGSWYLLMIVSWVLVTLVHRPERLDQADRAS